MEGHRKKFCKVLMRTINVHGCLTLFEKFLTDKVDHHYKEYFRDELKGLKSTGKNQIGSFQAKKKNTPDIIKKCVSKKDISMSDSAELNSALFGVVPFLEWYQIFDGEEIDPSLSKGLIAGQIVGKKGLIKSNEFYMGLFFLSPKIHYPLHQHNPLEIYYVFSGTLQIQHGRRKLPFSVGAGNYSITPCNQVHSLTTNEKPCFICYMWVKGYGDLQGPNWWWEEQKNGSWKRVCWERQPDSKWKITGSEKLTQSIVDASGDS